MFDNISVRIGRVIAYTGSLQRYIVTTGGRPRQAALITDNGFLFGSRSCIGIAPGSYVLVASTDNDQQSGPCDYIIGVIPSAVTNESLFQADADSPGAGVGFLDDVVPSEQLRTNPVGARYANYNNYGPHDGLSGEWGVYNPFGVAAHIGNFMAYLRASDKAGIWCHTIDDSVRMVASIWQAYTAIREIEEFVDEGEVNLIENLAMYPWESMGAFQPGTPTGVVQDIDLAPEEGDPPEPGALPIQPAVDRQRGIFRSRMIAGYAGDLIQRFVQIPTGEGVDSQGQQSAQGVFREQIGADGSYLVQSAKSLTFEKYSLISFPEESRHFDEPEGDRANAVGDLDPNYKASGLFGGGEALDHTRQDFDYLADETTPYARAGLGLELHGFMHRNSLRNIRRHAGDFNLAPESGHPFASGDDALRGVNTDPDTFILERARQWMRLPKLRRVDVDHRYTGAAYYASRSAIQQLDDGSVVIEDGYGSQIIMSGGNIIQTAANDVITAPGRNAVTMAGQDIVSRAGDNNEVTAGSGDLRLKGQKNVQIMQAAEDEGGMIIDVRRRSDASDPYEMGGLGTDADPGGLVIRASDCSVAVLAKNLVQHAIETGHITAENLRLLADLLVTDVSSALRVLAGDNDPKRPTSEQQRTIYEFGTEKAVLGSRVDGAGPSIEIHGTIQADGSVSLNGSVTAVGGFVGPSERVTEITDAERDDNSDAAYARLRRDNADAAASDLQAEQDLLDGDLILFNTDSALRDVFASYRTDEQYGTAQEEGFILFEFRWQQFARAAGASQGTWEEPSFVGIRQGGEQEEQLPYPGRLAWEQEQRQARIPDANADPNSRFYDVAAGRSIEEPEDPSGEQNTVEIEKVVLSGSYVVNSRITE